MSWDLNTHMRLYPLNFNNGLAKAIYETYKPKTILEFGCGVGYYCKFWSNQDGVKTVHGIEPNPMDVHNFSNDNCKQILFDITTAEVEPNEMLEKYDLVVSIEVAEHIDKKFHKKLFDFLCSKSKNVIVFSGARVGQGGHGHVAERPELEWRQEFLDRKMLFDEKETTFLRKECNEKNINHRKNIQVFKLPKSEESY